MSNDLVTVKNFIGGEFVDGPKSFVDSYDPSTGLVWARIPDSGPEDVEKAVRAASDAQKLWAHIQWRR